MKTIKVETLENLVEEYKRQKVNYSTYEFDELSYRLLILEIHSMIKENQKYKEVIKKAINEIENGFFFDGDERFTYLETWMGAENLLNILKEVEDDS